MTTINQQELHRLIHYDAVSGRVTRKEKTAHRHKIGESVGWINSTTGYWYATIRGTTKPLTHWIWLYQTGAFPDRNIDHIDGQPLNNAWVNLRDVSQRDNMSNKHGPQSNNKLGVLGVDELNGKYRARIKRPDGGSTHIGMFNSIEEAYEAYKRERSKFAPVEGL